MDIHEMRAVLARVAAYRQVCEVVRRRATHTLVNGVLFLILTGVLYGQWGFHPVLVANAAIGIGEILVGLWKKFRPSPEGILVDSLLQFAFAGTIAVRQFIFFQAGWGVSPFSVFIGIWVLVDAVRTFQAYVALIRAFKERPTREQLAQVRALARDVIDADPSVDQSSLDLPTRPPLKARLLGDVVLFAEVRTGNLFLVERPSLRLVRTGGDAHPDAAVLIVDGEEWGEFPVDSATWANFVRWNPEAAR
jgi:hypothetical protein